MTWTQIHLALNHVPVMGAPFLLLLLGWGLFRRSSEVVRLAHGGLILLCALSIGLKFTGDFAAESDQARLAPVQAYVNQHEQAADQAATGLFLLGLASAVALFAGRRRKLPSAWANGLVILLALLTCLLLARTAHLGGQIGHPELRAERSL